MHRLPIQFTVNSDAPKRQDALSRLKGEEANLLSRLASLRSSMQKNEHRIASLRNSRALVSLPPELLAAIFLFSITNCDDHSVTISHVCQDWRGISLSLPSLWTRIQISSKISGEIVSMFLERSRACPLDILIDLDDGNNAEKSIGDRHSSHSSDSDESYDKDEPPYSSAGGRLECQGEILFPTMERWRTLSIRKLEAVERHVWFMERLRDGSVPLLERLDIQRAAGSALAQSGYYHMPMTCFLPSGVPKLLHLTVRGGLSFHSPLSNNITTLILEELVGPDLYDLVDIFSPSLVELQLKEASTTSPSGQCAP